MDDGNDDTMTTLTMMAPSLMMATVMIRGGGRTSTCARAWPAWYYLIGIHAADKFANRARAAREGPFDRNVEKPLVF